MESASRIWTTTPITEHVRWKVLLQFTHGTGIKVVPTMAMTEKATSEDPRSAVEIQVTRCPECGTEWERVVTRRRAARRSAEILQE